MVRAASAVELAAAGTAARDLPAAARPAAAQSRAAEVRPVDMVRPAEHGPVVVQGMDTARQVAAGWPAAARRMDTVRPAAQHPAVEQVTGTARQVAAEPAVVPEMDMELRAELAMDMAHLVAQEPAVARVTDMERPAAADPAAAPRPLQLEWPAVARGNPATDRLMEMGRPAEQAKPAHQAMPTEHRAAQGSLAMAPLAEQRQWSSPWWRTEPRFRQRARAFRQPRNSRQSGRPGPAGISARWLRERSTGGRNRRAAATRVVGRSGGHAAASGRIPAARSL